MRRFLALGLLVWVVACNAPAPTIAVPATTPTQSASSTNKVIVATPTFAPTLTTAGSSAPTPAITIIAPLTPPPTCPILPIGSFNTIWASDPGLQTALGCPDSMHPRIQPDAWQVKTSYQPFEHGIMLWSNQMGWYSAPIVFVLHSDSTYQMVEDHFDVSTDKLSGGEKPPAGLFEPLMGFGKIWREQPNVRQKLGWATANETSGTGRYELFALGDMVWFSQTNQTYVFVRGTTQARVFNIPFSEKP